MTMYDILRPDNPGWNTGLPPYSLSFPRLDFAPKNLAELLAKSNPLGKDLPLDAQDMGWYSFSSMLSIVEPLRVGMFRIEGWHGMKSCSFEGTPWNAHSFWKIWRCASIPDQRSPIAGSDVCSGVTKIQRPSVRLGPEIAGCNATQIDDTNPVSYQVAGSMRGVWPVGVPEDRAQSKAKHDTRFSNIDACWGCKKWELPSRLPKLHSVSRLCLEYCWDSVRGYCRVQGGN